MAITPYNAPGSMLGFAAYQPKFIGRPVNDIAKMVDYRTQQNQRLINQASATDLALSNVDINPEDVSGQQYLLQHKQRFKNTINDIIDNNNYKLAPALISKVTTDFVKDKGLQTAIANQKAREQYRADLKKRYEDGKISEAGYIKGMSQGAVDSKIDPNTGMYNKFVGANIYNYYDADKAFSDYADKFEPTETKFAKEYIYGKDPNGNLTKYPIGTQEITTKYKDTKKLKAGLITLANTNLDMYNSMKQEAEAMGMNVDDYINDMADKYIAREEGKVIKNNTTLYKPSDINGSNGDSSDILGFDVAGGYGRIQGMHMENSNMQELIKKLKTGTTETEDIINTLENSKIMPGDIKKGITAVDNFIKEAPDRTNTYIDVIGNIFNRSISESIDRLDYDNANKYYGYSSKHEQSKLLPSDEKDRQLTNSILKYKFGVNKKIEDMSIEEQKKWLPKAGEYLETEFKNEINAATYVRPNLTTTKGKSAYKGQELNMFGKEDGVINLKENETLSGNAANALWYNFDSNTLMYGKDFVTAANNGALDVKNGDKKLTLRIKGVTDYRTMLPELTQQKAFSGNVAVVDINGTEWYAANPNNSSSDYMKHKLYIVKHNSVNTDISNEVLPSNILNKYGKKVAVNVTYNKNNGKYNIILETPYNNPITIGKYDEKNITKLLINPNNVYKFSYILSNIISKFDNSQNN